MFLAIIAPHDSLAEKLPSIQLEGGGDSTCPSQEQLSAALVEAQLTRPEGHDSRTAWSLHLLPGDTSLARFALFAPTGHLVFTRVVPVDDCSAAARAIAIIVKTHFFHMAQQRAERPLVVTSQGSNSLPKRPALQEKLRLVAGVSGGIAVPLAKTMTSAVFELDMGMLFWRDRLFSRIVAQLHTSSTIQESATDRLIVRPFGFRLDGGVHWDTRPVWWRVFLGAGAALWSVTAEDLPGSPAVLRVHPSLALGLSTGLPLTPRISLRLETKGELFLFADRYLISPQGEVGRSPRSRLSFALGFEFRGGR